MLRVYRVAFAGLYRQPPYRLDLIVGGFRAVEIAWPVQLAEAARNHPEVWRWLEWRFGHPKAQAFGLRY